MSKLSKIFLVTVLTAGINPLNAKEKDNSLVKYIKYNLSRNPKLKVKSVTVNQTIPVKKLKGWNAVQIKIDVLINKTKPYTNYDLFFQKGDIIATDLISLKGGSLKADIEPKNVTKLYKKDKILFGNKADKAKYKIVIFSDPLCPFCLDFVPGVFKLAKEHPNDITLYYYHFPLTSLHPASMALDKAALVLEKRGQKDIMERLYADGDYEEREKDERETLKTFNKHFKTELKVKDINQKWVLKEIEKDRILGSEMMVRGTPTIFINGKKDGDRKVFEKIKKELKK